MAKRIKDTYQKYLWAFITANILIFWSVFAYGDINFEKIKIKLYELLSTKTLVLMLSPIITIVLNGIMPNSIKETIVFWRFKNRLPGCRAFSHFAMKDPRINIQSLKNKIGEFPKEPDDQNRLWYSLYQQYENDEVIWGSHKDFLITRDLASLSFLFLVIFGSISIFYISSIVSVYLFCLIVQYLLLSFSSRNYGNRFVCNVLAKASENKNQLTSRCT